MSSSVQITVAQATNSHGLTSCKWPRNKASNYQWISTGDNIVSEGLDPTYSVHTPSRSGSIAPGSLSDLQTSLLLLKEFS